MTMLNRVKQMEMSSRKIGRAHWISAIEPSQTLAQATAAYEGTNGPIGEDDIVLSWDVFPKETPPCA